MIKTNPTRSAIESVSDIIIETLTEEILFYNDLNKQHESQIRNVIFKQYEEMKKKVIEDLKSINKQKNLEQENSDKKINEKEIIISKRRTVEPNNENIKK